MVTPFQAVLQHLDLVLKPVLGHLKSVLDQVASDLNSVLDQVVLDLLDWVVAAVLLSLQDEPSLIERAQLWEG